MTDRRRIGRVQEVRAAKGIFEARAVTYGVVDYYRTVWAPGVFDECLNQHLPPLTFSHQHSDPIGRALAWKPTPEGPVLTCRLDVHEDVPRGRQVLAQFVSGTLTDVSVGFDRLADRKPTDEERRRMPGVQMVITRAHMVELAVVMEGAVPDAKVLALRGCQRGQARVMIDGLPPVEPHRRLHPDRATSPAAVEEEEILDTLDILSRHGL